MQPWLTVSTARRTRTQGAFWPAGMTGVGHSPSPCNGEWVRLTRSYRVGLAEIEIMACLRTSGHGCRCPGCSRFACRWFLRTNSPPWTRASGGLRVDRCLGAAPYWLTCIARAFRGPVSPRRRLLAGRRLDGQTRCLGRVEQAFVISHEGSQRGAGAQGRTEVDGIQAAHRHRRDRPG